jgi:hypothetical protein
MDLGPVDPRQAAQRRLDHGSEPHQLVMIQGAQLNVQPTRQRRDAAGPMQRGRRTHRGHQGPCRIRGPSSRSQEGTNR